MLRKYIWLLLAPLLFLVAGLSLGVFANAYATHILVILVASSADAINPCSISVMILLLSWVVLFSGKPEKTMKLGLIYIIISFLTYYAIGLFFLGSFELIARSSMASRFMSVMAAFTIIVGVINILGFFFPKRFSYDFFTGAKAAIVKWLERATIGATVVFALVSTFLETPCSFPLYGGTINYMLHEHLSILGILAMLVIYNIIFVLPLIIILWLVYTGKEVVKLKNWERKANKYMNLVVGVVLVLLGLWVVAH